MEARELPNLFDLVGSYPMNMEEICAAVRAGADLNAVNDFGNSVLLEAVRPWHEHVSLDLVRLLVELGAEIRYEDPEGGNALSSALYRHEPDLIACLLTLGADPNVVMEGWETVLDMAEIDLAYHEYELRGAPGNEIDLHACAALTKIVELLESAGGKSFRDMVAERPRQWIRVFATNETGLTTRDGRLDCEKLPNVTTEFCQRFRQWLSTHFDTWPDKSFDTIPSDFDRVAHTDEGRKLARKIKRSVGGDILVEYGHICAEWEARRVRNVVWENISTEHQPAAHFPQGNM